MLTAAPRVGLAVNTSARAVIGMHTLFAFAIITDESVIYANSASRSARGHAYARARLIIRRAVRNASPDLHAYLIVPKRMAILIRSFRASPPRPFGAFECPRAGITTSRVTDKPIKRRVNCRANLSARLTGAKVGITSRPALNVREIHRRAREHFYR